MGHKTGENRRAYRAPAGWADQFVPRQCALIARAQFCGALPCLHQVDINWRRPDHGVLGPDPLPGTRPGSGYSAWEGIKQRLVTGPDLPARQGLESTRNWGEHRGGLVQG